MQDAAVEVRSASVFGEAIIAIVYLPILALRGIEGKLFHPMATTVLFALLGAFILSLTVVPVLTSYFVTAADARARDLAHASGAPRLRAAPPRACCRGRRSRWASASWCSRSAAALCSPASAPSSCPSSTRATCSLEARRLPGIALTESVATDLRVEQRPAARSPRSSTSSRATGAPEVATDPMGVEQTDVYITLKPRDGVAAAGSTKAELGEEIAEIVEREVPEMAGAVSQPIQMRTNELIAGVRSDVAAPDLRPRSRRRCEASASR